MIQSLTLPFYDKEFVVYDGSYYNTPKDHYTVLIGNPRFVTLKTYMTRMRSLMLLNV